MLNLNSIRELDPLRQRIAQAIADYLAAGGTIDRADDIAATLTPAHWRDNQRSGIPGARKRPLTRHEQGLADRIRGYVSIGMTERAIRTRTGLNTATLRKIARQHRIVLRGAKDKEAA